ncbi:MAG: hypothetical protein EOM30_10750 [Clostridia bacterium]|nr:hypothetical protein [Clostridia bacterium]NLS85525.1 hypothetical protein [Oscillospiraceae bacterium]
MKKRIMSAGLVLVVLISLAACGTSSAASVVEQTSSSVVAESEVETEPNPWLGDVDAYHKRLEAAGLHWKLNDDGSKPEEWTVEYYEGEEYEGCDGLTWIQDGNSYYTTSSLLVYEIPNEDALDDGDLLPEEQCWAMSTADFKRGAPDIAPPTDEDFKRFKQEAQEYIESRGAGEYPLSFMGYNFGNNASNPDTPIRLDTICVGFIFVNNLETDPDRTFGGITCVYRVKDYSNIGYSMLYEGLDAAYGEGTSDKVMANFKEMIAERDSKSNAENSASSIASKK